MASYVIENDVAFANAIDRARRATSDLRIPLTFISKDFYRSEKAIFALKRYGQYPDITKRTKSEKRRLGYTEYPILKRTGRLEKSLTQPRAKDSINHIVNRQALIIGTRVPYYAPHQFGAPKINLPMRKALFIGPEAPRFATGDHMGRLERWNNTLNAFVLNTMEAEGFDVGSRTITVKGKDTVFR